MVCSTKDRYPLVSILIPMYNHERYIFECLSSVVQSNYPNIEILICDDGSTDQSFNIAYNFINSYKSISFRLFKQNNQGICKTLNRLINESCGKYISICASDDLLAPDGIMRRVNFLESNKKKSACIGDAFLIDQYSSILSQSAMSKLFGANINMLQTNIIVELVLRWSVTGPTLLVKKSAYDDFGLYDENLRIEDRDFYLRLLSEDSLGFIPFPVASYRIHSDSITRKSISVRSMILIEVAKSNLKNSPKFQGLLKLFLKSHAIDFFILLNFPLGFGFYVLLPYRFIRKIIIEIYLKFKG